MDARGGGGGGIAGRQNMDAGAPTEQLWFSITCIAPPWRRISARNSLEIDISVVGGGSLTSTCW